MLLLSVKRPRLLGGWKTPYHRRIGEQLKGLIFPCGAMVEYHPTSTGDQSRLHQFGKKVLLVIVLGCALIAEGIWKEDSLIAGLEEVEKMNASEIYPRRVNVNEVLISHEGEEFVFPIAGGTSKLPGREHEFREPTLGREQTVRSEESNRDSRRIGRASTDRTNR